MTDPGQDQTPPFDGPATSVALVKPVNLVQLAAEIGEATETAVNLVLVGPSTAADPVSADNPATLWCAPPVGADALTQAVEQHQPVPNWGPTPTDAAFTEVWEKLIANPSYKMSAAEQRTLVIGLAFRLMNASPAS